MGFLLPASVWAYGGDRGGFLAHTGVALCPDAPLMGSPVSVRIASVQATPLIIASARVQTTRRLSFLLPLLLS